MGDCFIYGLPSTRALPMLREGGQADSIKGRRLDQHEWDEDGVHKWLCLHPQQNGKVRGPLTLKLPKGARGHLHFRHRVDNPGPRSRSVL